MLTWDKLLEKRHDSVKVCFKSIFEYYTLHYQNLLSASCSYIIYQNSLQHIFTGFNLMLLVQVLAFIIIDGVN